MIFVVHTQDVNKVLVWKGLMEVKNHGPAIVMKVTGIRKILSPSMLMIHDGICWKTNNSLHITKNRKFCPLMIWNKALQSFFFVLSWIILTEECCATIKKDNSQSMREQHFHGERMDFKEYQTTYGLSHPMVRKLWFLKT